jgi:hypothetical protein
MIVFHISTAESPRLDIYNIVFRTKKRGGVGTKWLQGKEVMLAIFVFGLDNHKFMEKVGVIWHQEA